MNAPKAWLCVSSDGSQVDATASTTARDTYARCGRTITPLYDTPPGPHAMTAQAGAVAELTIGTHEHDWGIAPSPAMYRLPAGEYSLYPAPPAAVPVEALEGLVKEWHGCRDGSACGLSWAEVNDMFAYELTQLIKERSNG